MSMMDHEPLSRLALTEILAQGVHLQSPAIDRSFWGLKTLANFAPS
jgi:hypothetical protein